MKTEGILPRSEVTMEVRRCQCAHHCRVQMQSPNAQASDVKLVEHVPGSCDGAGTEWRCAVGALPRVCQSFNVCENLYQESHSLCVCLER